MELKAGYEVMILSSKNKGNLERNDVLKIEEVINGKNVKTEGYETLINLDNYIISIRNPSKIAKKGDRILILDDLDFLGGPSISLKGQARTVERVDWHGTVYIKQGGIPSENYKIIN